MRAVRPKADNIQHVGPARTSTLIKKNANMEGGKFPGITSYEVAGSSIKHT